MKDDSDIEELLNGFIDGELSTRQQTEVQRLIAHDKHVARRLRELQKCKMLVGSLPPAEPPAEMVSRIKSSLAKETLLTQPAHGTETFDRRVGTRHLLARNIVAAAAMIALVAGLVVTVYTIIGPETVTDRPVAIEQWQPPAGEVEVAVAEKPIVKPAADAMRFNGRLEMKTGDLVAVDAFINRAIEENGLSGCVSSEAEENKRIYALSCSREALNLLLADLQYVWDRFDSATLFVETEQIADDVVVNEVTPEQVAEIANQDSLKNCVRVAKDFAVLNNMDRRFPGKEILAAIDKGQDLIAIPRPVLTSAVRRPAENEKAIGEQTTQIETGEKVHLTIVVAGSE